MSSDHLIKTEKIFRRAVQIVDPVERKSHVREACEGDIQLQQEIESLLAADDGAGQFLEVPPVDCDVTLDASPLAEGPGTIIGPYKLLEKIGEGGMAVVYMAQQKRPLVRTVAVKIIKLGMDTKEVIARFEVERQALAMMDHPNIAKVLDAGVTDTGRPYFVMELVKGISITDYCDKHKLSTQERLKLLVPVCNAIHHAHQKGIIHRDLKPSNIMVTMHDGQPVPKVIDFGIAKATNQQLTEKTVFTRYAQMIGTPEYMSPEQAEMSGMDIDTRTDIYSLGIVLYELLTGALPFDPETLRLAAIGEIQRIIREDEPLRPSTRLSKLGDDAEQIAARRSTNVNALAKRLHRELEWIPMKAMRKDRTRRYRSASELTDDIKNYLAGVPLIAGPESAFYRLQKFVHRYRLPVAATTGIAAALIIGFVVSTSFYIRVKRTQAQMARLESQIEIDKKLSTAQQFHTEGRYQDALTEVETLLQEDGSDVKMQLFHAQILFDLGRQVESEPILLSLLGDQSEAAAAAHSLLAKIYLQGNPEKAKEHHKLAESLQLQTADAFVLRALTADTPKMRIEWLSKAIDLEPKNYAARQNRALAYYGSKDFGRMLADIEAIITMRPEDKFGYSLRALAKRGMGEMEDALKDHDRVIGMCRLDSESARCHSQRQETLFRMKDYRAALRDAQRSASLDPANIVYRIILGRALFATDQYEKAAQEFELVHESPGFAEFRANEIMLQFTSDLVREGKTVRVPENLASVWPFNWIRDHVARYKEMAKTGTLLAHGVYGRSSWSPDGKQLAYARSAEFWGTWDHYSTAWPTVGAMRRGIEVLDMEKRGTRVLVRNGVNPAWSPDGKYIAFTRQPSFFYRHLAEVLLIPAQGGEARRIGPGDWPCWSGDSKRLYYHSSSENALYCIDIDDPLAKPQFVLDCQGEGPSISRDEHYVADFLAGVLTIVERSSGQEVVRWVVPGSGKICAVQWSPDGNEISVCSYAQHGTMSGLWVFNIKEKQGWHVPAEMGAFCNWSRDRTHMAMDLTFPICEVWLVKTDPKLSTREVLGLDTSRADYMRENWDDYARSAKQAKPWIRTEIMANLMELAANQYDDGQFEDALWLLKKLDEFHQTLLERPHSRIVALTAQTQYQLGSQDEAEVELTRLRQIYAQGYRHDEDILYDAESTVANNDTLGLAWDHMVRGEFTKAMAAITPIEDAPTMDGQVQITEGIQSIKQALARAFIRKAKDIRQRNGHFTDIIESIDQALSADPNHVAGLRALAWLQAVCPDASLRNGMSALGNARRACELTEWKDPGCLTTLAAAYGEAGEYDQAVKRQQEALKLASEDTCAGQRREMELRLKSYQSGTQLHVEHIKPLIAHWTFDHVDGRMLTDASGNGHDAQLMGAARLAPDQVGSVLLLGSEGGHVECPDESAFDLRNEMAISCWIRVDAFTQSWQAIVTKGGAAWRLVRCRDTRQLAFHCTGLDSRHGEGVNGQMAVEDGSWHHVVATFDRQKLHLYVDGILDASVLASGRIATSNEPVWIGANSEVPLDRRWNGSIDEVRIYARSLRLNEIRTLYEEGKKVGR
jgi:serine/threonine protein kinase